ncbi:MAG: helix-turn-helix domain-containing protein [Clostridia bacterium]|nr:helix-turn-helix domain-containing protein [Clostridia bacterium]
MQKFKYFYKKVEKNAGICYTKIMAKIISKINTELDDFSMHHTLTEAKNEGVVHGPESHGQMEILYLLSGGIKYFIEGEEYAVNSGDVIVVASGEMHSIEIPKGLVYERIVVMFDLDKISKTLGVYEEVFQNLIVSKTQAIRVIPKTLAEQTEIKKIMLAIAQCERSNMPTVSLVGWVLNLAVELSKILGEKSVLSMPLSIDKTVKQAIEYVNQNLDKKLSLDEISAAVYVSKSSLCHKFASSMKMTVSSYVTVKKIHKARQLIKEGMSVYQAAREVGYEEYSTFYHSYKKYLGCSPTGKPIK